MRDLFTSLEAALYQGRIKSPRTLGFFRKPVEEVRIRNQNDLETAFHEIGHLLDFRFPEIRKQWTPASKANATVRAELSGVSYDRTKLYEGFAEFLRLWTTQKAQAQAKAPTFNAWFENWLDTSPAGPSLRKAQEQGLAWFDQAALDRARSKIGEGDDVNAGLTTIGGRFRQSVFDDLHGILEMERGLTGKVSPVGPYETARLVRGKAAIVEGALTLGAPKVNADGSHSFVGKGLKQILEPVTDKLDDFLMYSVGRSARELKGQGRENLFTDAEIKAMLALDTPAFRKAFVEYQAWNDAVVDFAQAKGVINPASRAAWRRAEYMPFHRVGQGDASGTKGTPGDWKGIRLLTGGTANIRGVLENVIKNASALIDVALTNEARLKVAGLSQLQGGAKFMARIPTEDRAVNVSKSEIERAMLDALGVGNVRGLTREQAMVLKDIIDGLEPLTTLFLRQQAPAGRNVVAVLRGGKPEYYEVADPLLYRSMTSLNRPAQNWLVQMLSIPKRVGQATITLTPDFMGANLARDTMMGAVMSKHGFRPLLDSAKGLMSRLRDDQNYRDFIANGGGFSSHLLDEANFRTHLAKFYKRKGVDYRTVLDASVKLLDGLERIAAAVETATRLGEFKRAREAGANPRHAAYSAREVSTDFAMRGDSQALGFLYDTVIFLKAGMNGLERIYRGVVHDENRAHIAAKTAMIGLVSAGLYALNRDNPLYDQLEDWDRDMHWHLFVPRPDAAEDAEPKNRYLHFRIPKIWEIGAVGSLAERSLQGLLDGQPVEQAGKMLKTIANLFNFELIPQALAPAYEVAINRDRFRDAPIENQAMKEMEPFARAHASTSRTLRSVAEATRTLPQSMRLSPAQIEHLLEGYFNSWATYGLSLLDGAFYDGLPDARLDDYPGLRRFFRQEPARTTRFVTELYDAIDEATAVRRTMRFMDRTWRPEIADELEQREGNASYGQLTRADRFMRALNKEADHVVRAPDLETTQKLAIDWARSTQNRKLAESYRDKYEDEGALKRILLDDITNTRNEFAKRIMTDVKERKHAASERK